MPTASHLAAAVAALLAAVAGPCLLACLAGCQHGPGAEPPQATQERQARKAQEADRPTVPQAQDLPPPPRGEATISGSVLFSGTPLDMPLLPRNVDPLCSQGPMKSELFIRNDNGTLRNVLVRVVEGPWGKKAPAYPPPAEPLVIDQRDCMYRPRIATAVTGQQVVVNNGDPTLHNVHALHGPSTLFNKVQVNDHSPAIRFTAERPDEPGSLFKLRCDVHQWMVGYVYVADHPFVAVTGSEGSFALHGLPDGKYTVEAWHELLGVQRSEVTAAAGKPVTVNFKFTGTPSTGSRTP